MDEGQKERVSYLLKKGSTLLSLGFLYYLIVSITGHGIPCVIHLIFKIQCPGCGITRSLVALIQGNLALALQYNALAVILLGPASIYGIYKAIQYVKVGHTKFTIIEVILLTIVYIITIIFTIYRNFK